MRRQENVPQASRELVREDQNQTGSDERNILNFSKPCDIRNAIVQNKCIDMVNVHDVVDESRHPPWAREILNVKTHPHGQDQHFSTTT